MRFHKAAASKDDSVAKVANSAAQPFLEREFAVLLLNDLLSLGQSKCRRVVFAGGSAPQKTGACDTLCQVPSSRLSVGRSRMILIPSWARRRIRERNFLASKHAGIAWSIFLPGFQKQVCTNMC